MMNSDIVMLYSGGADSRLMLHWAIELGRKPHCILIDYGQKHIQELEYAISQLDDFDVPYQIVKIDGLCIDSGLTGSLQESRWDNVHSANVPGRNTIFISIAYSIAENLGIDEIWFGPDYSDRINLFPDCYQEYVVAMNKILEIAPVKPIKLVAPLLGWSKEMILEYLKINGIQLDEVYSGYAPPVNNIEKL